MDAKNGTDENELKTSKYDGNQLMRVLDSLALQDKRRVRARVGSATQAQGAGDAVSAEPPGRRGEKPLGGRGLGAALLG